MQEEKQEKKNLVRSLQNLLSLDKVKSLWTTIKKIKLLNVIVSQPLSWIHNNYDKRLVNCWFVLCVFATCSVYQSYSLQYTVYTYISCMGHMITNTMSVLCPHLQLCFYLVFSIHLMASIGSMLSTLVPPILSDHFGFDIEYISYFTLFNSFYTEVILFVNYFISYLVPILDSLLINGQCLGQTSRLLTSLGL